MNIDGMEHDASLQALNFKQDLDEENLICT